VTEPATTAVVFDVDGTLVDSERDGHRVAFNVAFAEAGLPDRWSPELYGQLLRVSGGRRRIEHYLTCRGRSPAEAAELAVRLHLRKTEVFVHLVRDGAVTARSGVEPLLAGLEEAGAQLHVVTTGSRRWVMPVLDGLFGPGRFGYVVTGDDVQLLKPHPQAYLRLLARTGLSRAHVTVVEDSRNGVRAATAAGLACVMVTNDYTVNDDPSGAWLVASRFAEVSPDLVLAAAGDRGVRAGPSDDRDGCDPESSHTGPRV
jgi:HAD superfamily hydrolase (TIGR01509 family)